MRPNGGKQITIFTIIKQMDPPKEKDPDPFTNSIM